MSSHATSPALRASQGQTEAKHNAAMRRHASAIAASSPRRRYPPIPRKLYTKLSTGISTDKRIEHSRCYNCRCKRRCTNQGTVPRPGIGHVLATRSTETEKLKKDPKPESNDTKSIISLTVVPFHVKHRLSPSKLLVRQITDDPCTSISGFAPASNHLSLSTKLSTTISTGPCGLFNSSKPKQFPSTGRCCEADSRLPRPWLVIARDQSSPFACLFRVALPRTSIFARAYLCAPHEQTQGLGTPHGTGSPGAAAAATVVETLGTVFRAGRLTTSHSRNPGRHRTWFDLLCRRSGTARRK